jgi:hypothetical protein
MPNAGLMRTRSVVSGSRLLQNGRAAILESGSPPGLGQLVRAERLQTYRVHFSPFKRPAFLSYSSSSSNPATRIDGVLEYRANLELRPVAGGVGSVFGAPGCRDPMDIAIACAPRKCIPICQELRLCNFSRLL